MKLAFELGRERNPSVVAHDRRSKLAKSRVEVGEKTREFNHWATEADKHIEHKVNKQRLGVNLPILRYAWRPKRVVRTTSFCGGYIA